MRSLKVALFVVIIGIAATAIAQSKVRGRLHAKHARLADQAESLDPSAPIPFQGRLTDSSGNPVAGQVNVAFALYSSATATSVLWTETHSVTPQDGWFSVVLGDTDSGGHIFPAWDGSDLWLGVTVQGDVEMTPRTPILPVPYAVIANPTQHADTHALDGTDPLGSITPTSNELVRGNASGVINPGWLPLATIGTPGAVLLNIPDGGPGGVVTGADPRLSDARTPLAHAATHQFNGSDVVGTSTPTANAIPMAGANGQLAAGWSGTATPTANAIPIAGANGQLATGWLGTATPTASSVPISDGNAQLNGWIAPATTSVSGLVTLNSGAGSTSGVVQGSDSRLTAAKITRTLCIFVAGPSGSVSPTLMLPPDLSSCVANRIYGSSSVGPSSSLTLGIYRYVGGQGSQSQLIGNTTWAANLLTSNIATAAVSMSASDVIYAQFSSSAVSNATACLQVTCSYQFQ